MSKNTLKESETEKNAERVGAFWDLERNMTFNEDGDAKSLGGWGSSLFTCCNPHSQDIWSHAADFPAFEDSHGHLRRTAFDISDPGVARRSAKGS